jgi:hypothetical protein
LPNIFINFLKEVFVSHEDFFTFILMKPLFQFLIIIFFFGITTVIKAQTTNDKHITMSDAEMDNLIDSLLMDKPKSTFSVSMNYQNRTLFAGRDLGIKQWNSTLNLSYYHWSGFYADFSTFLYSKSSPKVQLTALSLGYMGDITENLSFMADLSKTIETNPDPNFPNQLPYAASLSLSYSFNKFMPNADYTLLFGNETARRLRLGISYYQSYKDVGFLDRISLTLRITAILGNQDITYAQYWSGGNLYSVDSTNALIRNPFNQKLTKLGKKLQTLQNTSQSYFGLMAMDFAMGISAVKNNFRFTFTPHIVKPVRLYIGEDISVNWQFYAGVSCGYTFK